MGRTNHWLARTLKRPLQKYKVTWRRGGRVSPGDTEVAATAQSFDEALAFALAEWPDWKIRVVVSRDVRALIAAFPQRCPHSS